ncbi:MAG: hypothetical protein KAS63_01165 [Candidatus Heimdallarchaeota archaeon]|nr:hypothetical protein [Candidatus Heimdallarchaeota archaeon]MCK4953952.1 hypothetical protein [Candidatus Heimdallarchaeota archaeon]
MDPKELAKLSLELIQDNRIDEIIPLIVDQFQEDKDKLKALIQTQIQMKEIGGGYPPVGKQIRTIKEIITFTEIATKFALEKDNKLSAGILYHNLASFCFPNMDEGVDEKLIQPGFEAAVKDFEIRIEIGEKNPLLWAKWLIGVIEFIKGDVKNSINTLEKTAKLAKEEPVNFGIEAWSEMMIVKFKLKSGLLKKKQALKKIEEIKLILEKEEDNYGLNSLEEIRKKYLEV